ncbi:hypothetical protein AK88_04792 [Plasmodium fragile]|uniref:Uncharacterized protein n=1 Tax=Plasmodium fragile TaxID=5857 RepID=A0A0D9QIP0_PLAFR|nr:uncharacterized protein AK88_04792 [Plasmodium fragile]KJP85571.1 hypothetical protein AK88_04792 [Plasmodium fragile]
MNIFNARCCLLTLFFFLFEKKFCKKGAALSCVFSHAYEERTGSAGTVALSNETIYYTPSGGLAPCSIISRQLSGDEDDSGEDDGGEEDRGDERDDDGGTPSYHLDGDADEYTAEDGGAKRKMSRKEEEAEDKKIDKLVNAEMKKHEVEEEFDKDPDSEPDKEDLGSGQGRREKLRCTNKLNYIQVTANDERKDDLFGENDQESAPAFAEKMPHKIKEDMNSMPSKQNETEEAYDRIDRAEKENNVNDLKFVEARNTYVQKGEEEDSKDSTDLIEERKRERSSFIDLKNLSDNVPRNFTNSSGNSLFKNNLEKTVHKHLPWSVLASDSASNGGSWADVNSSTYNVSPFSFVSIHSHNSLHLMPMNFQVQNSIVKISDEAFDKLKLKNSVHVYDKNELVDYKYESFEVKEGEEYNDENEVREEKDEEGDADSKPDQNNASDGRGFFDGTLVTCTIVILVGVIILLLSFVIYYYDLINKVKRRMSAKRKNNKSMTIANDSSAGMYMDDTYKESPHV